MVVFRTVYVQRIWWCRRLWQKRLLRRRQFRRRRGLGQLVAASGRFGSGWDSVAPVAPLRELHARSEADAALLPAQKRVGPS